MAITDVTAWAVSGRINKVVSPLEYVHGSREAPGSAMRVVSDLREYADTLRCNQPKYFGSLL